MKKAASTVSVVKLFVLSLLIAVPFCLATTTPARYVTIESGNTSVLNQTNAQKEFEQIDSVLRSKANVTDVYNTTTMNASLAAKANVVDVYNKTASDARYDVLGASTTAVSAHNSAYNHTLIGTALQSESDTLSTVLGRGNTTNANMTVNGLSYLRTSTTSNMNGVYYIDGVTYARTSAALQALVDSFPAKSINTIYLTAGQYLFTNTVSYVNKAISWIGLTGFSTNTDSTGGVEFYANPATWVGGSGAMIDASADNAWNGVGSVTFSNLQFRSTSYTNTFGALKVSGIVNANFDNIRFSATGQYGLWLDTGTSVAVGHVLLNRIYASGAVDNVKFTNKSGSSWFNAVWFTNSWIYAGANGGAGLLLNNVSTAKALHLSNIYFEGVNNAASACLRMIGAGGFLASDIHCDNGVGACIDVSQATTPGNIYIPNLKNDQTANAGWIVNGPTVKIKYTDEKANANFTTMNVEDATQLGDTTVGTLAQGKALAVYGSIRAAGAGNVGVGTTQPSQKLDVVGTARSTAVSTSKINDIFVVDGITYAKTSTAIQSIVDSIPTNGEATIYFPVGTYTMTSPVTITDKSIYFVGSVPSTSRYDGTVFTATNAFPANSSMFKFVQTTTSLFNERPVSSFANFTINGGAGYITNGIEADGFLGGTIRGIQVRGHTGAGVWLHTLSGSPVSDAVLDDVRVAGGNPCIKFQNEGSGAYITQVGLNNSWLGFPSGNAGHVIDIEGSVEMSNTYIETDGSATAQIGMYATGDTSVKMVNCDFDVDRVSPAGPGVSFDFTNNNSTYGSSFIGTVLNEGSYIDNDVTPSVIVNSLNGKVTANDAVVKDKVSATIVDIDSTTVMSDDFTDNVLDTSKWTPAIVGGTYTITEQNNRLEFYMSGVTGTQSATITSTGVYDLTNTDIGLNIVNIGNTALANYRLDLKTTMSGNAGTYLLFEYVNNTLVAKHSISDTVTTLSTIPYSAAAQKYIRTRNTEGVTYWEYSADAVKWTTMFSEATPFVITAQIPSISVWGGYNASATTVSIDDFMLKDTALLRLNGQASIASDLSVGGSVKASDINGVIYIDGVTYPRTSAGIQAAVDSIPTGGNARVVFTDGSYTISSTITVSNKGISFEGSTPRPGTYAYAAVRLVAQAGLGANPMFSCTQTVFGGPVCSFKNVEFFGQSVATNAISFIGWYGGRLDNVTITGTVGAGLRLNTNTGVPVSDSVIDLVRITACDPLIEILNTAGSYVTQLNITNSWLSKPSNNDGVCIEGLGSWNLSNVYLETEPTATAQTGIYATGSSSHRLSNCTFDVYRSSGGGIGGGTAGMAFDFTSNSSTYGSSFVGCSFQNNAWVDNLTAPSVIVDAKTGTGYLRNTFVNVGAVAGATPTTNQFQVGSSGFSVTSVGNVGVGTTAPSAMFQVGAGNFSVTSLGNLGLGTTTPTKTLDIVGTSNTSSTATFGGNVGIATTAPSLLFQIGADNFGVSASGNVAVGTTSTTNKFQVGAGNVIVTSGGNVGVSTTAPSALFQVGSGNFNVTSAGNTGVGTTAPTKKLDVAGTLGVSSAATLASTLSVTGETTLSSTASVAGTLSTKAITATGTPTVSDVYNFGDSVSTNRTNVTDAATFFDTIYINGKTSINGISAVSGAGDYFYMAHKNSNYTVTYNVVSAAQIAKLFDNDMSTDCIIPISDLATTPFVLTITKNAGTISASDTINLAFAMHRGYLTSGTLTDWKVEYHVTGGAWVESLNRTGASDSGFMSIPLHMTSGYENIDAVRLTISGATAYTGTDASNLWIGSLMLRDFRPSFTPANALGALDQAGGTTYGATNLAAYDGNVGVATTAPTTQFQVGAGNFNVTSAGNVGVGKTNPTNKLDVVGNAAVSGETATGTLRVGTSTTQGYLLTADSGGNATWQSGPTFGDLTAGTGLSITNGTGAVKGAGSSVAAASGYEIPTTIKTAEWDAKMSGTGTATALPVWATTSTLGSSNVYAVSSNVGIGTTQPATALSIVSGTQQIDTDMATSGKVTIDTKGSTLQFTKRSVFTSVFAYDGSSYVTNTTEAGTTKGTSFASMVNTSSHLYLGRATTFTRAYFDIVSGVTSFTPVVEYWNGSAWTSLTITDTTAAFANDGVISYTLPGDWAQNTVNGATAYFVRVRTSSTPSAAVSLYSVVPDVLGTNAIAQIIPNAGDTTGFVANADGSFSINYPVLTNATMSGAAISGSAITTSSIGGNTGAFTSTLYASGNGAFGTSTTTNGRLAVVGTGSISPALYVDGSTAPTVGSFISSNTGVSTISMKNSVTSGVSQIALFSSTGSLSSASAFVGRKNSAVTDATIPLVGNSGAYLYNNGGELDLGTTTANSVNMFTGGTAAANIRMTIDANGNVGVGTTVPTVPLHVAGAIVSQGVGNVGIGTTLPVHKLDVVGNVNATTYSGGNVANWDTAYAWGNHGVAGYAVAATETLAAVTGRGASTTANITTTGNVGAINYFASGNQGVTATGTSCTITRIEGGVITAATCS